MDLLTDFFNPSCHFLVLIALSVYSIVLAHLLEGKVFSYIDSIISYNQNRNFYVPKNDNSKGPLL
uniref:Uncharacterized protein n=1 Tax=Rhizophora mucronata TaxID=61149 RepID=A0A2P2MN12_RHIMU